jgi:GTP-binding protein EngB required for normal cell division
MLELPQELAGALDASRALLETDTFAVWPTRDGDLATLATARERLERRYTLAVVGEFSSGKSYLLNALLGQVRYDERGKIAGLLATDINPSTATITELEYGSEPSAVARYESGRTERIPLDRLARFVAVGRDEAGAIHDATADSLGIGGTDEAPSFVVVRVDSPFLRGAFEMERDRAAHAASGFVVADTPGLASLNPAHRRATLAYLPRTDAVLYLIDTQQPFTEGDASFLGLIGEHVRTIFIVQTKIDLWRMREADGREAWQSARARIVERAAFYAPNAEVFSVSARDFAAATLELDAALRERSGFPALFAALDRSLAERALAARVTRTLGVLRELTSKADARLRREAALLESSSAELQAERERAETELAERERSLGRERDEVARAGGERRSWIVARGEALAEDAVRALATALDVADIERIRDRSRLHGLVDSTTAPVWTHFAEEVAGHVARALERIAHHRPELRVADLAAARLGGEPGTGAWSRDLRAGVTSTIVLGAIGGPTVSFVHAIATAFARSRPGTYMKRELGGDLQGSFFPAFERDVGAFVADLAARIDGIYEDLADAIERERRTLRAETVEPIERALSYVERLEARRGALAGLQEASDALRAIEERLRSLGPLEPAAEEEARREPESAELPFRSLHFDADTYGRGLRPQRYRVVILGALRRGKSSLINAIAGTRLLQDEGAAEALFPVHVRYGERERAYALEAEGIWREIPPSEAMAQAACTPVLIEIPWKLPPQLVLVHAPAFDSGNAQAEEIALAAAGAASEIVALFSRQLSDRELALYERVGALQRPMLLAHTIADNESPAERRNVVELAARYLLERGIDAKRIFTISALDFFEARQTGRAPAAWNELGALRETLQAHAEEHMRRLAERERRMDTFERPPAQSAPVSSRPNLRKALQRFLGGGR